MSDAAADALRAHPMVHEVLDGGVVHHSEAPVIELTAPLSDLLVAAARAASRVVIRSSAASRLTGALAAALRDLGGVWLVEDASGAAWDGLTGREVDGVASALDESDREPRVAPAFVAGADPEAMQVTLAASIRHRRDTEPRSGTVLEAFATALGAPPSVYGPHEPLERAWDRAELATLVARRPDAPRLLVAGTAERPMSGSVLVRPTGTGSEEAVETTVALDPAGSSADRIQEAFVRSAADAFPLFGFVLARPGRRDLTRAPVLAHAPAPVAVLIGAPGVRDLGVDVDLLVRRFAAVRVGRPRVPAVLVPFGGRLQDWEAVESLVGVLGPEQVGAAFGRPVPGARS
jgi:hypothetical protein